MQRHSRLRPYQHDCSSNVSTCNCTAAASGHGTLLSPPFLCNPLTSHSILFSLPVPCRSLPIGNASGTLPDDIWVWGDLETFSVSYNPRLGGTIPSYAKAWTKLTTFNVNFCNFTGALPELPYSLMTACVPLNPPSSQTNRFECPFPAGITANCSYATSSGGPSGIPVTDADCAGPCTGNSTKLALDQCDAWIAFYDSTNGDKWTGKAAACAQTDPCSCFGSYGAQNPPPYPVCDPTGTTVQFM